MSELPMVEIITGSPVKSSISKCWFKKTLTILNMLVYLLFIFADAYPSTAPWGCWASLVEVTILSRQMLYIPFPSLNITCHELMPYSVTVFLSVFHLQQCEF